MEGEWGENGAISRPNADTFAAAAQFAVSAN